MKIDCIETNQYSLGILGRSGTRSFANFVSRYYFDYVWEQHRNLVIGKDNPNLMFPTHHPYTHMTIDDFNNCNYFFDGTEPTIMVIRDPLERANLGGAPSLTQIEWEYIDYVIPFEDIKMYIGESRWSDIDVEFVSGNLNKEQKAIWELTRDSRFEEWSVEDYDYTDEIDCYNQILNTKKQLPPDMWHQMVRDTTWCNIPSKHLKQMN